jgi:hypothetical protein
MKKISVITLQNVRNYGSVLQALATQKILEDLGYSVDFYNYNRRNISSIKMRIKTWVKKQPVIKKIIMGIILYPTFIRQNVIFNSFIKKYLHQQKNVVSDINDFRKIQHNADIYCTGSDQTWNSDWNGGVLPEVFLEFAPQGAKKIAYAASIGKSKLDDYEIEPFKNYLKQYSAISVRESSAVDIIKNQLNLGSVTQVLDPTLQVTKEFWESLLSKQQKDLPNKGKYVLLYQLNTNKEMDIYAKEFATKKGWPLIRFCTRFDQFFKVGKSAIIPKVTDFISLIANAGCVITDSFHATAFCCNMNIPMICIYPKEFGGRLASLLKLLNLENRHLENYNDFSFTNRTEINFSKVNEILDIEREKGFLFLKRAVI